MRRFEFYVGINPKDEEKFFNLIEDINSDHNYAVAKVVGSFDDPESYYTFIVEGTYEVYKRFHKVTANDDLNWIKSLYHYEE